MATVRVSYDDLPKYKWPIHKEKGSAGYTLIQATTDDGSHWAPKWVLVDSDGENIAIIEIDDIDPDPAVGAKQAAEAAYRVVQEIHGVTPEETGEAWNVAPAYPLREPPPQ